MQLTAREQVIDRARNAFDRLFRSKRLTMRTNARSRSGLAAASVDLANRCLHGSHVTHGILGPDGRVEDEIHRAAHSRRDHYR